MRRMSVLVSLPISSALRLVSSCRMTVISSASAMTWLLAPPRPEESMMRLEPSEVARRGCASGRCWPRGRFLSRKSLKNSSKGEPGGNCGISGRCRSAFSVCVVEMLTTAGRSLDASSEKPSGPALAAAGSVPTSSAETMMRASNRGDQPCAPCGRRLPTRPRDERLTAVFSILGIGRDRRSLRQTAPETHSFDITYGLLRTALVPRQLRPLPVMQRRQHGEIAAEPAGFSPADEPDDDDADAGGGETDGAQQLRRYRQHLHDDPPHAPRKQRVERTLDDQ